MAKIRNNGGITTFVGGVTVRPHTTVFVKDRTWASVKTTASVKMLLQEKVLEEILDQEPEPARKPRKKPDPVPTEEATEE